MRNRVNELYKEICVPKPKCYFEVVDLEKGETVEEASVLRGTNEQDIVVLFVT